MLRPARLDLAERFRRSAGMEQDTPQPASPPTRSLFARALTRLAHLYFTLARGMTMGVRAACFDEAGRVFLVRHSYVPGWHLPGGGVGSAGAPAAG